MQTFNIVCVDDEPLALRYLTKLVQQITPSSNITAFSNSIEALEYMRTNKPDIVFLDIDMPYMNGIELARNISRLHGKTNIILTTAYDNFAMEAFGLDCSGYVLKPLSLEDLTHQFEVLRYPIVTKEENSNKLVVKCFGEFEVFYKGVPLSFKHKKTKELFAYLIDRRCAIIPNAKIISMLWEDDELHTSYFKNLRSDLISTLLELPFEVLLTPFGALGLLRDAIECDYYDYLENKNNVNYNGEYMEQYFWAEPTKANLK